MSKFVRVAHMADVPVGTGKFVRVGDRFLALFHTADGWRCIDNECPHRGAALADGELVGSHTVLCPWHSWPFSLTTGKSCDSDLYKVEVYPVRLSEGEVHVELPE